MFKRMEQIFHAHIYLANKFAPQSTSIVIVVQLTKNVTKRLCIIWMGIFIVDFAWKQLIQ